MGKTPGTSCCGWSLQYERNSAKLSEPQDSLLLFVTKVTFPTLSEKENLQSDHILKNGDHKLNIICSANKSLIKIWVVNKKEINKLI